jgi:hypothetical protein
MPSLWFRGNAHADLQCARAQRQGRRLLRRYHQWKSAHLYLGRYSIEKLIAFEEYQRLASPARVLAVAAMTPFPALIIVLVLAAIPLQSPLTAPTSNVTFFLQSGLSFFVVTLSVLLFARYAGSVEQGLLASTVCADRTPDGWG